MKTMAYYEHIANGMLAYNWKNAMFSQSFLLCFPWVRTLFRPFIGPVDGSHDELFPSTLVLFYLMYYYCEMNVYIVQPRFDWWL
jgi:hypothetical protein